MKYKIEFDLITKKAINCLDLQSEIKSWLGDWYKQDAFVINLKTTKIKATKEVEQWNLKKLKN